MSGELSQFEQKSANTPKNVPYAILGGTVLALIIVFLVNAFGKNEAVDDLKKLESGEVAKDEAAQTAAPSSSADDDEI